MHTAPCENHRLIIWGKQQEIQPLLSNQSLIFILLPYWLQLWLRFNFCKYFLSLIYTKTCFSFSILISFIFSYCVKLVWIQSSASVSDFNTCTQHLVELNTSHMNFMHIFFVDIVCWFFFVSFLLLHISAEQSSHGSYKKIDSDYVAQMWTWMLNNSKYHVRLYYVHKCVGVFAPAPQYKCSQVMEPSKHGGRDMEPVSYMWVFRSLHYSDSSSDRWSRAENTV